MYNPRMEQEAILYSTQFWIHWIEAASEEDLAEVLDYKRQVKRIQDLGTNIPDNEATDLVGFTNALREFKIDTTRALRVESKEPEEGAIEPKEGAKEEPEDSPNKVDAFSTNIEEETIKNRDFRRVLFTGKHSQLVLMSIEPGEEIGDEVHNVDQFFRLEGGEAKFVVNGEEYEVEDGDSVTVLAGSEHNVINTSDSEDLKLYSIYSPPQHKDGTVHKTKADAEKDKEDKPDSASDKDGEDWPEHETD
jgi:mannose-6-phosphate isomerase-like protein (cupin superfamily)